MENKAASTHDARAMLTELPRLLGSLAPESRNGLWGIGNPMPADLEGLGLALMEATETAQTRVARLLHAEQKRDANSPLFNSVSIFRATGNVRRETSVTQALAWLLDPRQSHCFQDSLFDAFLEAANCSRCTILDGVRNRILHSRVRDFIVHPEYVLKGGRADLFIHGRLRDGESWSLVVEVKIDASEGENQLRRYHQQGPNALHVFLTPRGIMGATVDKKKPWAPMRFLDVARAFLMQHAKLSVKPGGPFLRLYTTSLLSDICGIVCDTELDKVGSRNSPFTLESLLGDIHGVG